MYTGFAEIYDQLMSNVDYESWADHYASLMAAYGIAGGKICECACGTGNLTIPLNQRGYQVTGVDMSQDMLWRASQKARQAGVGIPFVKQDMRKLRLHRRMDAVLATCDGVNYLLTDEDLSAFFGAAYEALRDGGSLFFDISTPYKLRNVLGNQMICEDTDEITYFWQNSYSEKTEIVDMHLCFFVKQEDGSYKRIDEDQKQKAHSKEKLTELLVKAGFDRVMIYGNNGMEPAKDNEQRWHVVAQRRNIDGASDEGRRI